MERINFPQITGQSDLLDPVSPGRFQYNFFADSDDLEKEYDQRL
jgi:hypothetical protein